MTKFVHCVFVKHEDSEKKYLFCVDDMERLQDGQEVVCDTKFGKSFGKCIGRSFTVSELALESICKGTGATIPLSSVIGIVETKLVERKETKFFKDISLNDIPF